MTYIFITLGLIITYFIISAIKEGEARETIAQEKKANNRKLANIHFENLIANELKRQETLKEARKNFSQLLEKEEGIHKVSFDENILIIVSENNIDKYQANNDARVWIETLIPSTGVDVVKIYNRDGTLAGSAERNSTENLSESIASKNQGENIIETKDSQSNEKVKFNFSSMFYSFCFSKETAQALLEDSEIQQNISKGLIMTIFEEEKLFVKILKTFLKKKYGFILPESNHNFYNINGFELFLFEDRVTHKENVSYFEIVHHDIESIKDEEGMEMAIAQQFIVYCINNVPSAIFVLVKDPIIEKYAIRKVIENGTSVKLSFFDNVDRAEHMDFLMNYV